jgi:hypothetical protein
LRRAVALKPDLAHAWQALAGLLRATGTKPARPAPMLPGIEAASKDPVLLRAAMAMGEGRLDEAARHVRQRLAAPIRRPCACWAKCCGGKARSRRPRALRAAVARAPAFAAARELLVRLLAMGPTWPRRWIMPRGW